MESILTTPSGIQVHIVNTLIKHSDRLAVPYLAKLVGRPRPVVDVALKRLQEAGLVRLDGDEAILLDDDNSKAESA
jgi:predicted transcriptional regulator